jgi:hypothetical protein
MPGKGPGIAELRVNSDDSLIICRMSRCTPRPFDHREVIGTLLAVPGPVDTLVCHIGRVTVLSQREEHTMSHTGFS